MHVTAYILQVYIVRVKSEALIETDIDLSLVNLGARATEMVGGKGT